MERRKMSPKSKSRVKEISKWILQFLLSSFFVFVVVFLVNPRGSMGTQILFMLLTIPFTITLGMIIGDISLYTTHKFSLASVIASIILSVLGIIFTLHLADKSHTISSTIVYSIAFFCVLVLPPLIGYNFFSNLKRSKLKSPEAI